MSSYTKFRNRKRGSTTEEGYGSHHQRTRRQLFAALPEWFTCCRCGQLHWKWMTEHDGKGNYRSAVHLDHGPDESYLGFSSAACNRSAGAITARNTANRNRRLIRVVESTGGTHSRVW